MGSESRKDHQGLTLEELEREGMAWLLDASFLGNLSQGGLERVLAVARWRRHRKGEALITAGQRGGDVYLLTAGQAVVVLHENGVEQVLARLGPGHLVGERAHLKGAPTVARVTAMSPLATVCWPGDAFATLMDAEPELRAYVEDLVALRDRSQEMLALLLQDAVLRSLGREDLEAFIQAGDLVRLPAGKNVVRAGDRDGDVYLVIRGRVAVFAGRRKARELLTTQGRGWLFGYAAALLDTPRSADVETVEETELLRVGKRAFTQVISRNPSLQRQLYQRLAALDLRLDEAAPGFRTPVVGVWSSRRGLGSTTLAYGIVAGIVDELPVALVDLDGPTSARRLGLSVDSAMFGEVPVREAAVPDSWGRLRVIWPERPDDLLRLVLALRDHDAFAFVVVALAEGAPPDARLMEEANTLVQLRRASDRATDLAVDHRCHQLDAVRIERGVEIPLATTRGAVRIPYDDTTARAFWARREPSILVDRQRPLGRSCDRLGRALLGRTVGVALGGGGALGYAHVALLRALHDRGVPVDYVSGASFGAIVGGLYAAGGLPLLDELVRRSSRMRNVALAAVLTFKPLQGWMDRLAEGRDLGDTEIPFFPVSMDVLTGVEVAVTRGSVASGIRTSCGLPPFYTAKVNGTRRLVDGGMVNNVPASVVWDAGAHYIAASNIVPRFPVGRGPRDGNLITRTVLDHTVSRFDDLLRSVFLLMSQTGRDRTSVADYVFDLELQGFMAVEFARGPEIVAAARVQAERAAEVIRDGWKEAGAVAAPKAGR